MSTCLIPTVAESPTVPLLVAGKAMGFGRSATYAMLNRGAFPLPIIKTANGKARVPTAALRRILALDDHLETEPTDPKGTQ